MKKRANDRKKHTISQRAKWLKWPSTNQISTVSTFLLLLKIWKKQSNQSLFYIYVGNLPAQNWLTMCWCDMWWRMRVMILTDYDRRTTGICCTYNGITWINDGFISFVGKSPQKNLKKKKKHVKSSMNYPINEGTSPPDLPRSPHRNQNDRFTSSLHMVNKKSPKFQKKSTKFDLRRTCGAKFYIGEFRVPFYQ